MDEKRKQNYARKREEKQQTRPNPSAIHFTERNSKSEEKYYTRPRLL